MAVACISGELWLVKRLVYIEIHMGNDGGTVGKPYWGVGG